MRLADVRLLAICHDSIWPATHGYRIDIDRRLRRLANEGAHIGLVALSRDRDLGGGGLVKPAWLEFSRVFGRPDYMTGFKLIVGLGRWPWPAAARRLRRDIEAQLLRDIESFAPNVLLLEGLYGAPLARTVRRDFDHIHLVYRSHNIEHQYMRAQLRAATGLRSTLNLLLCNLGLERVEKRVIADADMVMDISQDDCKHWQGRGFKNVRWVPPLPASSLSASSCQDTQWDISFCGNLHAPNNVEAINWFVQQVWPSVRNCGGTERRFLLAGSRPSEVVRRIAALDRGICLMADPENMNMLIEQSRVLINPTLRGSGVNIKTIDMIESGRAFLSTNAGVAGLPEDVRSLIRPVDTSSDWKSAIERLLTQPLDDFKLARDVYSSHVERQYDSAISYLAHSVSSRLG
jgi:polysaccharide biosynthesis protein PslH